MFNNLSVNRRIQKFVGFHCYSQPPPLQYIPQYPFDISNFFPRSRCHWSTWWTTWSSSGESNVQATVRKSRIQSDDWILPGLFAAGRQHSPLHAGQEKQEVLHSSSYITRHGLSRPRGRHLALHGRSRLICVHAINAHNAATTLSTETLTFTAAAFADLKVPRVTFK